MYFIQLNQLLLADRQLSIFDKVVYAALCTLTQFNDPITGQKNQLISQNDLYNFLQSSISIGTIKRSLDKLRSLKYINVKETKYKNRITVIQTYTQSDPSLQTAKTTEIQNLDQSEPNSRSEVSAERSNNEYTEIQNLDHSDPPINSNSNNKKEEEEETPSPSFSYSTQYQKESRKESSDKFYKEAFQKYPRELVRAHEVSQCIDEMCECYELNAKEFERSKSNFKQTVRNRAEKIVKVLLDDKSDFAPMEVFWGIKLYETSSTSEPTPAGIKKSCIKCRIERNNYTDKLKYVLNLRSDDLNVPEDDFLLTSFVNRFGSELEGLENARYSESKDYDVKFNDLVLKMAELPVQDNIPDYWDMYRNQSSALPINLDIRQIA